MNRIIADVGYYETRAAVMEEDRLIELHFERRKQNSLVNNIYEGKIINLIPGLQTIFVDIGYEKNVFIYKDQLAVPFEHLRAGESLLIQITKDAMDDKGPKATMKMSLPGKYVVMLPRTDHIGISRKIASPEEKCRLQEWADQLDRAGHGLILRTEAMHQEEQTLLRDWNHLLAQWGQILEKQNKVPKGTPLYREHALLPRLLRDVANWNTHSFLVNDSGEADSLRQLCRQTMPDHPLVIETLDAGSNPFLDFQVEAEWERAMNPVIPLESGGSLVIHHTEALTAIDVNTGRYRGTGGFQESARSVNLEAASEIARQLRLRDLGGIIIIDFIDMKKSQDQELVVRALQEELKHDRQKTVVLGMTRLGLVEMTRKRTREKVESLFNSSCSCCQGSGSIRSIYWTLYEIESALRRWEKHPDISTLVLKLHPRRLREFKDAGIELKAMADRYRIRLVISPEMQLPLDTHELTGLSGEEAIREAFSKTEGALTQSQNEG